MVPSKGLLAVRGNASVSQMQLSISGSGKLFSQTLLPVLQHSSATGGASVALTFSRLQKQACGRKWTLEIWRKAGRGPFGKGVEVIRMNAVQ